MHHQKRANDAVHMYMSELTHRIVAESGHPSDRYHLGKIILTSLRDAPDAVLQIDGATNESETNGSVLKRSIRCAGALQNYGLGIGDVICLMAPNHLDLNIPFYAALYLGVTVAPVDRTLTVKELHGTFDVIKPKLIFCQSEKASDIQLALNQLDLRAEIITFDSGDYLLCSFSKFLDKYGDNVSAYEFRAADFDPEETTAILMPTSGTTGIPKSAIATHKNFAITNPYLWARHTNFPSPIRMGMIGSPLQWLTAIINFILSPIMRYTRLQSSQNLTPDHTVYLINTYKPTFTVLSPTLMTTLLQQIDNCDLSCFELILMGGSAVPQELIDDVKKITPNTEVFTAFGMTELTNLGFQTDYPPTGSCGKPLPCFQYRIVDVETQTDITEPNVSGELWMKGPGIIKGYYNNQKATEETFAEDGWFKTGDMFYRDENWNFFFVERIKLLLKYMSHQISPVEVEKVIHQHPGVLDVAVVGIPDPTSGELVTACVVRRPGFDFSAQEIKNLVKESLADSKQLRGGVIFMSELPMTASTKIHRRKLKEIALGMKRE